VRVRLFGDTAWTLGKIGIASANGRSIAVVLDDVVRASGGVIANVLPLFLDEEQRFICPVTSGIYEIEPINTA